MGAQVALCQAHRRAETAVERLQSLLTAPIAIVQ